MKGLLGFLGFCVLFCTPVGAASRTEYLNKLPLRFEENRGRDAHPGTRYIARTANFSLGLDPAGDWLEWKEAGKSATVSTRLAGSNPHTQLKPEDRLPGTANYFLG